MLDSVTEVAQQDLLEKAKALLEALSKLPATVFHPEAERVVTQAMALHGVDASISTLQGLMVAVEKLGPDSAAVVARTTLEALIKTRDAAKRKDKTEELDAKGQTNIGR